jgi:hypothetical protein
MELSAMKTDLLKQPALTKKSADDGKASRKLARERAVELAFRKGRSAQDVSKSDWEQAKRELRGESDAESPFASSASAAESERWDPLPGSIGHKVQVPSGDDEDDEGRSDTERLVERGVRDAGRDQMHQATREGEIND